ncbi:MAG: glycosyltransferase, partial [Acidobacteria bacterium]|nr:glycosyltransferase [Acidobacteriota bacterium]
MAAFTGRPQFRGPGDGGHLRDRDVSRQAPAQGADHGGALGRRRPGGVRGSAAFALIAAASGAYWVLVLIAGLRRLHPRPLPDVLPAPGVSVLKPRQAIEPGLEEALRSHARQDYPQFEVLCDSASLRSPNPKVGVLAALARRARYPVLVVNDADITVSPEYLRRVVAELEQPGVGLVTCLFRARGLSWPARFEALAVSTEFAPGVLVARLLGIGDFALGATMALRARDLDRIGGFGAVGDYLADDYWLGRKISGLGLKVALSREVVETRLTAETWRDAWRHQVRWARTVRVSRPGGYRGYLATHATLWALAAALAGAWPAAAFAFA